MIDVLIGVAAGSLEVRVLKKKLGRMKCLDCGSCDFTLSERQEKGLLRLPKFVVVAQCKDCGVESIGKRRGVFSSWPTDSLEELSSNVDSP